ncbi:MAG: RNA-binding protein [Brevinematales bacterium]|nr:RNA-binding protein [Brevinematales bacterium]
MESSRLYVGNLKYGVTSEQLSELFAGYGEVKYAKVIEGKGFGFVEMGNSSEAENAMNALNGQEFAGRTLKIDEAKPRERKRNPRFSRREY